MKPFIYARHWRDPEFTQTDTIPGFIEFHLRKGEREKGRGRVERERERNTLNFFLLVPVLTLQENDLIGYFKSTVHLKTNEPGGGRDDYRL